MHNFHLVFIIFGIVLASFILLYPLDSEQAPNQNNQNQFFRGTENYDQDYSKKIHPHIMKIMSDSDPKTMARALGTPYEDDKIFVYVYLDSDYISNPPTEINIIEQDENVILAKLSMAEIETISDLDSVERVALPIKMVNRGHAVSQGVSFSFADDMHAAGFTGNGITVGVIDGGFFPGNSEISGNVISSSFGGTCSDINCGDTAGNSHGTAVAEIIVDMAPDVSLRLKAVTGPVSFNSAVQNFTDNNVDIITTSLAFFEGSAGASSFYRDGTSSVANKVNQAKAAGILVTAANGNQGISHWQGTYTSAVGGQPDSPITLDSSTSILSTSIAVGTDGFPVIAYDGSIKFVHCTAADCSTTDTILTLDSAGGGPSLAIGSDGFPVISYEHSTNHDLQLWKCVDVDCSTSVTPSILDSSGNVGIPSSIAIGSDGFPVISYSDNSLNNLKFVHCNDVSCTSFGIRTLDSTNAGGTSSIAIGFDGFPAIAYVGDGDLKLIHCEDVTCDPSNGGFNIETLTSVTTIQSGPSLAIGSDGFPVISFQTFSRLRVIHCTGVTCPTPVATQTLDGQTTGVDPSVAIGSDGIPVISYHDVTNNALKFVKCRNVDCSIINNPITLDSSGVGLFFGRGSSIAIGSDGFPVISYKRQLKFVKCTSITCGIIGPSAIGLDSIDPNYQSVMNFRPAQTGVQQACLPVNDLGDIYLATWNAWPITTQDYDFFLYDSGMTTILGGSTLTQNPSNIEPLEIIPGGTPIGNACLVVASFSSTQNHFFHIDAENNEVDASVRIRAGSLDTPADATGALAVGAIRAANPDTVLVDELEPFSSSGPTDDNRNKPEICGPDNTLSHQSGLNPFLGTSSATPHVAGAAALMLDQNPSLTVDQLRNKLINEARTGAFSVNNQCGGNSGAVSLQTASMTFTTDPTIKITKNATNADGAFSFTISNATNPSNSTIVSIPNTAANNMTSPISLIPGFYNVTETVPVGWTLDASNCLINGVPQNTTLNINVTLGDTAECIFENEFLGSTIKITKNAIGGNATFNFTVSNSTLTLPLSINTTATNMTSPVTLNPGLYNVTETVPAGWTLDASNCLINGVPQNTTLNINVTAGDFIECIFEDTLIPPPQTTIKITKNAIGGNAIFNFTVANSTVTLPLSINTIATNMTAPITIQPGSYNVTETVPAGWTLDASNCLINGVPQNTTLNINITAEDSVECIFENTKQAGTRLVSTTGTDSGDCIASPCKTIQFAIDQAADGDTIQVSSGTYPEKLTILSRNNLMIQGAGATNTIIQGDHTFSQVRIQSSTGITISDLTIRDGGDRRFNEGGAVQAFGINPSSSVVLQNLILTSNEAVNGGAIDVDIGNELTIINSLVFDNAAANGAGAILVGLSSLLTIESTTIVENTANFLAGGIFVENGAQLTVRNSIFWDNNLQQIDTIAGVSTVSFSDILGGHVGVGNINQDPLFVDALNDNFRLSSGSPAIDAGTNIDAPTTDLDGKARPIDGDGDSVSIIDMGAFEFGTTIKITKIATGGDAIFNFTLSNATFTLPLSINTTATNMTSPISLNPGSLNPGIYNITEIVPAGWTLDASNCLINGVPQNTTLNINVTAGDTAECIFVDTFVIPPPCTTPSTGDWTIISSCVLETNFSAPANVIVQNNSVLTIPSGVTLDIDFVNNFLRVEFGSGVLIKSGGAVT